MPEVVRHLLPWARHREAPSSAPRTRDRGTLYRISARATTPVTVLRSLNDLKALHAAVGCRSQVRPMHSLHSALLGNDETHTV